MADLYAYAITQSRDRVALVAVGTVAAGTVGDTTQLVLGKPVVPRASVTFLGSVKPEVCVGDVAAIEPPIEPPDTTAPGPPQNLHTTSVTGSAIVLAWDQPGTQYQQQSKLTAYGVSGRNVEPE